MTKPKTTRRALLAAGLSGLILPGKALPQTRERDVEGGIGGTGIVGTLVGFGSLFVGGHRVQTNAQTRFVNRFGRISEENLRVGESLTVEAARNSEGQLVARRVHVDYPVIGSVTRRSADGRSLIVAGVEVVSDAPLPRIEIGERVAVSGLWEGKRVRASLLSQAPRTPDVISGTVDLAGPRAFVGGMRVLRGGLGRAGPGGYASVVGQFDAGERAFIARDVELARFTGAAGALNQLSIEGWLEPADDAPGLRVAGLGHSFSRGLRLSGLRGRWLLMQGSYDGLFRVETAQRLPSSQSGRARALRDLGDG